MTPQISREEALDMIRNSSKFQHQIRVGKIMANLADYFQHNKDEWELVGLLHDYDYDLTEDNRELHGLITAETFSGRISDEALEAIKSHDYRTGYDPDSLLARMLISADAFDTFYEMIKKDSKKITINLLKTKLKKWDLPKPWLKQLILNVQKFDITLDSFLEKCIQSVE